jgi:hypothetical protein
VVCDAVKFDGYVPEYEIGCLIYQDPCHRCDNGQLIHVYYLRAEAEASYTTQRVVSSGCHHSCDGSLNPELTDRTLIETETYDFRYADAFNNRISQHHVSYIPEITVPVCDRCHGIIHRDTDELEAFEPEMKRKEWQS